MAELNNKLHQEILEQYSSSNDQNNSNDNGPNLNEQATQKPAKPRHHLHLPHWNFRGHSKKIIIIVLALFCGAAYITDSGLKAGKQAHYQVVAEKRQAKHYHWLGTNTFKKPGVYLTKAQQKANDSVELQKSFFKLPFGHNLYFKF